MADREVQPSTAPAAIGREERIEDERHDALGHAAAAIVHAQPHPALTAALEPAAGDVDALALVVLAPANRDGVARIGHEVHQDLLDLLDATVDGRQLGR